MRRRKDRALAATMAAVAPYAERNVLGRPRVGGGLQTVAPTVYLHVKPAVLPLSVQAHGAVGQAARAHGYEISEVHTARGRVFFTLLPTVAQLGRRADDLYEPWERPARLPSPRYSSLLYHCGSRGADEPLTLDKFNTGEGYAAFGKGVYFSSRRSVAEAYCQYTEWPELTVAVVTRPLLDGKRGGKWHCVECPPNEFGMKQCWCPEGVLAAGYAGVRIAETSGPKRFAEVVVYDTSAITVVKTIDMRPHG